MEDFFKFKKGSLLENCERSANNINKYRKIKFIFTSLLFTQVLISITSHIQKVSCTNENLEKFSQPIGSQLDQNQNDHTSSSFHIARTANKLSDNHFKHIWSKTMPNDGLKGNLLNSVKTSISDHIKNVKNKQLKQNNQTPAHNLYVELHNEADGKQPLDVSRYGEIAIPLRANLGDNDGRTFSLGLPINGGKNHPLTRPGTKLPTGGRHAANSNRHYLPNGPPPFRPSTAMILAASSGALEKLKSSSAFKRMHKSKAYYLLLDLLRQLTLISDSISKKKMNLAQIQVEAVQALINKLASKAGSALKLKWPLVMLNPHFVRELLSNPTYLVMLFHAVEVAAMSMPSNILLKRLVKFIAQPSPEKEEKIWWQRKRLYDTLNGYGASELQPNLRAIHFRNPGEPTPFAIPTIVDVFRRLTNRPPPNPAQYKQQFTYPPSSSIIPHQAANSDLEISSNHLDSSDAYMTQAQEEAFLANQMRTTNQPFKPQHQIESSPALEDNMHVWHAQQPDDNMLSQLNHRPDYLNQLASGNQEEWLNHVPHQEQLMSKEDFESLDPQERERMLKEVRDRFEESKWTNELIRQHSEFVNAFANSPDGLDLRSDLQNEIIGSQMGVRKGFRGNE